MPGAVYYYVNGSWGKEKEKIVHAGLRAGDMFGWAVALSGETAVFSAPGLPPNLAAAFAYVRSGEKWKLQEELHPPVPELPTNEDQPIFGKVVAVSGDIALVGAPDGHAFPYIRSGTSWAAQSDLQPEDSIPYDGFGSSVALSGNTAMAGAPGSRKVYVYTLP